jgi:predicted ATPase
MELLGVEFENFARFERQFVPLKPGLHLLVGRNNAGKTALLRAIGGLGSSLLGASVTPFLRYLPDGRDSVIIRVIFALTPEDQVVKTNHGFWVPAHNLSLSLVFEFRAWRTLGAVLIEKAYVEVHDTARVSILEQTGKAIMTFTYLHTDPSFPPSRVHQGHHITDAAPANTPAGTRFAGSFAVPELGPLQLLKSNAVVQPHRVTQESMTLQTADNLSDNAENLPNYLLTLSSNNRRRFHAIEQLMIAAFPEFDSLNTPQQSNIVRITFTLRESGQEVPLHNAGTGVEQLLALACLIEAKPDASVVLLDEPHSFLHPSAERYLADYLNQQKSKMVIVSTHSAVLINEVDVSRITNVEPPGIAFEEQTRATTHDKPKILADLGYRNSDLVFEDALLVAEGRTEVEVLPILLEKLGVPHSEVRGIAFLELRGVDESAREQQSKIRDMERVILGLGRTRLPRVYLFDGDRNTEHRNRLLATRIPNSDDHVQVRFLPVPELENYLLIPEAIAAALNDELHQIGSDLSVTTEQVATELQALLASGNPALFPTGKTELDRPERLCKGSAVLSRLFDNFEHCKYDKIKSGKGIAAAMTPAQVEPFREVARMLFPVITLRNDGD